MENKVTVKCKTNVMHNGKSYKDGDTIVMDQEQAEKLLRVNAVEMTGMLDQTTVSSSDAKIAKLQEVIEGLCEELQSARGMLSTATAQVDDLLAENKKLKNEHKADVPVKRAKA